ncbi:MAG: SLBB domain-containing protein [Nitrospirae bacterium]|nr:SLBB domain-containing protein [Nitrospirota bacterium]
MQVLVPEFRASIKELKADLKTAPRGLSRLVTVRPDGYVTFPLVGDTFVGGRTFPDVNNELNERYDKIIPGLYVDLFLEHHAGSRMYILGQVYKPGVYDIPKPLTIEQAVAMAGGYTREARLNDIFVVRKQYDRMIATRIDFANKFNNNNREYKFFYLKPDDILYVPKRPINKAAELMRDISEILLFRGWSLGFNWELHDEASEQP